MEVGCWLLVAGIPSGFTVGAFGWLLSRGTMDIHSQRQVSNTFHSPPATSHCPLGPFRVLGFWSFRTFQMFRRFRRSRIFRNPHWQSCGEAAHSPRATKSEPCERTRNWCAAPPWHRLLRFADALAFRGRSPRVTKRATHLLVFIVLEDL